MHSSACTWYKTKQISVTHSLDFCYFQHKFYFLQITLLGSDLPDICGVTVVTVQCRDLLELTQRIVENISSKRKNSQIMTQIAG